MKHSLSSDQDIKISTWFGKKNQGFSLLELMVVIIIAVILSTITLLNFPLFSAQQSLQVSAEEVAQIVREAQLYGISIKSPTGSTISAPHYGIFIGGTSIASGGVPTYVNKITLFTDTDVSGTYNLIGCGLPGSECVKEFFIKEPIKVQTLCYHHTGIINSTNLTTLNETSDRGFACGSSLGATVKDITILFKRPNPEPEIKVNSFSGAVTPINYAKIVLAAPDGSQKSIYISRVGQIAVNNFGRLAAPDGCPAIFAWNGESFVFEHEAVPFALGTFFEGTSFTKLDTTYVKDNKLVLRVAEEKDEISFVDRVAVWAVDVPRGSGEVLPGEDGSLYVIKNKETATSCVLGDVSCLAEVKEEDGNSFALGPTTEAVLTFRSTGTDKARLVLLAKANPLAEEKAFTYGALVKPALSLAESVAPLSSIPRNRILQLIKNYKISIEIKENGLWREVGVRNFGDGKPFVMEINSPVLTEAKPVEIRLRSSGWYIVDSAFLDSSDQPEFFVENLIPIVLEESMLQSDGVYTKLNKGESRDLTFSVPPLRGAHERSFVFSLSGYYETVAAQNMKESLFTIGRLIPSLVRGELPASALSDDLNEIAN